MTHYIKAGASSHGALYDLGSGRAEIWLYANTAREIVGFGSLGTNKGWPWPESVSPKLAVHHIPNLGLDQRFRRKPDGPDYERYSSQIIDDLIAEAGRSQDASISRVITLFVHPDNLAGIKVYERAGFAKYQHFYLDKATGVRYLGMVLTL